jgi:hypothetical protein
LGLVRRFTLEQDDSTPGSTGSVSLSFRRVRHIHGVRIVPARTWQQQGRHWPGVRSSRTFTVPLDIQGGRFYDRPVGQYTRPKRDKVMHSSRHSLVREMYGVSNRRGHGWRSGRLRD